MRRAALITIIIFITVVANGQIVATRSPVPQLLIPAAGAQQGAGNTFFRSDITIINYRAADQRVRLQWLPQNLPGAGVGPVDIMINAASGIASEDFVTNIMQQSGLGAIMVTGIDATGAFDPSARCHPSPRPISTAGSFPYGAPGVTCATARTSAS